VGSTAAEAAAAKEDKKQVKLRKPHIHAQQQATTSSLAAGDPP
jgi:hypothetical protein